jgi:hypothetical protein
MPSDKASAWNEEQPSDDAASRCATTLKRLGWPNLISVSNGPNPLLNTKLDPGTELTTLICLCRDSTIMLGARVRNPDLGPGDWNAAGRDDRPLDFGQTIYEEADGRLTVSLDPAVPLSNARGLHEVPPRNQV